MSNSSFHSFTSDTSSSISTTSTDSSSPLPLDAVLPPTEPPKFSVSECGKATVSLEEYLSGSHPFRQGHTVSGSTKLGGNRIDADKLYDLTREYFNVRTHLHHPQEERNLGESGKRREFIGRIERCFVSGRKRKEARDEEGGPPHYALPTGHVRGVPPPWMKQEVRELDEAEKTRIALKTFYKSEAARGEKLAAANASMDRKASRIIDNQKAFFQERGSTKEDDGSESNMLNGNAEGGTVVESTNSRPQMNLVQRRLSRKGPGDRQAPSRSNSLTPRRSSASLSHMGGGGGSQPPSEIYTILKKSTYNRTKKDNEKLLTAFRHMKAFEKLSDFILSEICSVVQCQTYEPKKVVFRQGDVGTCWYVIYKGMVSVKISKSGVVEEMVEVARLGPGLGFGDLALVNDAARAATIVAVERCELLQVEKSDYNRVLKFIHLKAVEEKAYFLKQVPIFSSWRAASLKSVSDKVTWVKFPAGSVVIRSGHLVEKLYFVRTGICDIYQNLTLRVDPAMPESERRTSKIGAKTVRREDPKKVPVTNAVDALSLMTITEAQSIDVLETETGDRPTFKTVPVWLGEYQRYDYFGQECALGSDPAVWPPATDSSTAEAEDSTQQVLSAVTVKARTDVELATIAAYDARTQVKSDLSPSPYQNLTPKAVAERYAMLADKKKWNVFKKQMLIKTVREKYADPSIGLNDINRMMEAREAGGTNKGNGKYRKRWK